MRTATFESTVDILVKAYLNDTLFHGRCNACAVGSICRAAGFPEPVLDANDEIDINDPASCAHWAFVFLTGQSGEQERQNNNYYGKCKEVIDATGYSVDNLALIEYSFETAPKGNNADEWMFNGLMAVVDCLASIHNVDLSIKENAKLLFVKSPN